MRSLKNKKELVCDYCGETGHRKEFCYKKKADDKEKKEKAEQ